MKNDATIFQDAPFVGIENADEAEARTRVVEIAKSWLNTPYHHNQMVKGLQGGVDCAMLMRGVYSEAGIIPRDFELPKYSYQWHLHRKEEKMIGVVSRFADEVWRQPLPGDVILWKFFFTHAHSCIVTEWPMAIHAFVESGCVCEVDYSIASGLAVVNERGPDEGKRRPAKLFSFWPRKVQA